MEINETFSICHAFGKSEKDTCVSSSGMNAMSDITYNFWLLVKFSAHMMNSTREKIGFSCAVPWLYQLLQVNCCTSTHFLYATPFLELMLGLLSKFTFSRLKVAYSCLTIYSLIGLAQRQLYVKLTIFLLLPVPALNTVFHN